MSQSELMGVNADVGGVDELFSNPRILVVDDDLTICESLAMILEMEGYLVDKAMCGQEAIELSRFRFYDLAIVDSRLPDIQGEKLLEKLKELAPNMAEIMITGNQSLDAKAFSSGVGPDAFFVKPMNMDKLLETISELLLKKQND